MIKKSIDFIGKKCYASGYRVVQGIGQSSIEKSYKEVPLHYGQTHSQFFPLNCSDQLMIPPLVQL